MHSNSTSDQRDLKQKWNYADIAFLYFSSSLKIKYVEMIWFKWGRTTEIKKWKPLYSHSKRRIKGMLSPPQLMTQSTANTIWIFFLFVKYSLQPQSVQHKTWSKIHTGCRFNHIPKKKKKNQSSGKERQNKAKDYTVAGTTIFDFFFWNVKEQMLLATMKLFLI